MSQSDDESTITIQSQQQLNSQFDLSDDDNDDLDLSSQTTKTKSTTTTKKTTTTRKTTKKVYPPFEVKMPELIGYNTYLKRPLYGNVKPWTIEIDGYTMSEPCMVGIDEAGRGPVLGAMVYGTCIVPISKVVDLKATGVNDSKQLKEIDREYLFSIVQSTPYLRWIVDRITAVDISTKMLAPAKESLNLTSHLSALHMVCTYIRLGFNVQEVYADTVGPADKYRDWLENEINLFCTRYRIKNPVQKVTVESKADATYPVVSAASICAKVTRDLDLQKWVCKEEKNDTTYTVSHEFGSGYPGDEVTKSWLRNHFDPIFGFPDLARFSWGTAEKILDEDGYVIRWGLEEDLPSRDATQGRLKSGFAVQKVNNDGPCQFTTMKTNQMSVTTELPF